MTKPAKAEPSHQSASTRWVSARGKERAGSQSVFFSVKVITHAARTELVGIEGDALKVKLAAVPEDGKANKALIELLSTVFRTAKSNIRITAGLTSRRKRVQVANCGETHLCECLSKFGGSQIAGPHESSQG